MHLQLTTRPNTDSARSTLYPSSLNACCSPRDCALGSRTERMRAVDPLFPPCAHEPIQPDPSRHQRPTRAYRRSLSIYSLQALIVRRRVLQGHSARIALDHLPRCSRRRRGHTVEVPPAFQTRTLWASSSGYGTGHCSCGGIPTQEPDYGPR